MVNNLIENGAKILNRNFTKDDVKIFNFICNKGNTNYNHHKMPYHFHHNTGEDVAIPHHSCTPDG